MEKVFNIESAQSTNTYLLNSEHEPFTAVYADTQTGGRGRNGRVWHTGKGNIALSVLLGTDIPVSKLFGLQIALGYAVVDVLSCYSEVKLKWPNDIVALSGSSYKKLGGLLIETRFQAKELKACVFGAGINISGDGMPPEAVCLNGLTGKSIDIKPLIYEIVDKIREYYELYRLDELDIKSRWIDYSAFTGHQVSFHLNGILSSLTEEGISPSGALLAKDAAGVIHEIKIGDAGYDFGI